MLSLSTLEIETLNALAEARYVERLMVFVRQECPSDKALRPALVPADDASLRLLIQQRLQAARNYGLSKEDSLAAFIVLSFTMSHHFDAAPKFQSLFNDTRMQPEARMQRAFELVILADAQRAQAA